MCTIHSSTPVAPRTPVHFVLLVHIYSSRERGSLALARACSSESTSSAELVRIDLFLKEKGEKKKSLERKKMKLTLVTKRKKEEMKTISTRVTTWFDKTLLRVQIYFAYVTLATLVSHRNDAVTMAKLTPPRLDPRKPGKYWQGYDKNMMYKRRAASIQQRIATQIITIHDLQDRLNRFDKNPWAKSTLKNAFTLTWKGFGIVTIATLTIAALLVTALHSV